MPRERGELGTQFMSVGEFARHLGVSLPTVYRMVHDGGLIAVRVGRQWRIDVDRSLERLATGGETGVRRAM